MLIQFLNILFVTSKEASQPGVFPRGTNEQAQIILFQTYYVKTWFSGEGPNTGKGGRKKKKMMMIGNKVDGFS